MMAVFESRSQFHFTLRQEAMANDPTSTDKKNIWSSTLVSALLPILAMRPPPPSHIDTGLDPRINSSNVGSHTAELTEVRRLRSRASSHTTKTRQRDNATDGMWRIRALSVIL